MEALLPVGRWKGYGGPSNFNNCTFESFTWASAIGAVTSYCTVLATVHVPPVNRIELEKWLWTNKRIRIRGGQPSKLRLSTPYYLLKPDVDRFLAAFDEFKKNNT